VYIPKADGRQRPLAVAAVEDKIVQGAVAMVLSAIYEVDFLGFSYGFRPGRGQHDALDALVVGIDSRKVSWILDADIRSFFDMVDQKWMIRFVEHRIGDPRIIRLIQKWMKAGVLEDGEFKASERGTGQGSVISPLLANIYLHYAFDLWADRWRQREATGDMIILRYADDTVVGFEHEADARRFLDMMRARLEEFALSLHPEKTRLIEFGRQAAADREQRGLGKPETFNFLGFTFICSKSRKGRFQIIRKTRRDRMMAKLLELKEEMRRRMHWPISEQGEWLRQVVGGFFNYHAVPTNSRTLSAFRYHVTVLWERRFGGGARETTPRGTGSANWLRSGSPSPVSYTLGRAFASPSNTRGRSRMRASRTYGSVRGAPSNGRSYRDRLDPAAGHRQPSLHQFRVMVAGIIKEDVDEPHARIHRLDRRQQHDRAESVHRQHIFHNGLAGFEVDRAMDVQTVSSAALFDRNGNVFRSPAPNGPHRVGRMHGISDRFIGVHPVQQGLVSLDEGRLFRRVQLAGDGFRLAVLHLQPMQQRDQSRPGLVFDATFTRDPGAHFAGGAGQGRGDPDP
jgi:group II intron reverse transcriptase/maturase